MSRLSPTHRGEKARARLALIERELDARPLTAAMLAEMLGVVRKVAAGFLADLRTEGRAKVRAAKAPGRSAPVHVYFTARTPTELVEATVSNLEDNVELRALARTAPVDARSVDGNKEDSVG